MTVDSVVSTYDFAVRIVRLDAPFFFVPVDFVSLTLVAYIVDVFRCIKIAQKCRRHLPVVSEVPGEPGLQPVERRLAEHGSVVHNNNSRKVGYFRELNT